jgi:hypothetical protein
LLLLSRPALQAAHADLFPIDYEDNFFIRATHGLDRSAQQQLLLSGAL